MKDDYLWDRSGPPDPEVERLEHVLSELSHDGRMRELPETTWTRPRPRWIEALRFALWPRLAAVAATLLVIVGAWLAWRHTQHGSPAGPGWAVASLQGAPRIGSSRIGGTGRFAVGQVLETDDVSRASISVGELGLVEVEPNTRIRLIEARASRQRLGLERGTIQAAIWAPPGEFIVNTPSAVVVDLGCAYTLHVDDSGAGLLRTTLGWVGFKLNGHESFIPAGAVCATRPGIGPGTPYFDDASQPFQAALAKLDFEKGSPDLDVARLQVVLADARPRDALTLWHLLSRRSGTQRGRVYERLAAFVPPPLGVTRDGVLAGNTQMLDLWWNQLGFGDTSLWRTFERSWPEAAR